MSMTLNQLKAFALVARLGSLRAAAAELAVSEPAVSAALAALRQDLGDPLFVRAGGGIALTPGGRALAAHAQEIVGLADHVRREVAQAEAASGSLRVLATAFCRTRRRPAGGLLHQAGARGHRGRGGGGRRGPGWPCRQRAYDIALGARPTAAGPQSRSCAGVRPVPALPARPGGVAGHPLARLDGPVLVGPAAGPIVVRRTGGDRDGSEQGRWLASTGVAPEIIGQQRDQRPGRRPVRRGHHAGARTHRPGRSWSTACWHGCPQPAPGARTVVGQHLGPWPGHGRCPDAAAYCRHGPGHRGHGGAGRAAGPGPARLQSARGPVELRQRRKAASGVGLFRGTFRCGYFGADFSLRIFWCAGSLCRVAERGGRC